MPRIYTKSGQETMLRNMARPSRNSYTAYALKNYNRKDELSVQVTEMNVHAVLHCSSVMWWMVVAKVCVECGWRKF